MKTVFDDTEKAIIRDHGSFTTREVYPASHYDGELPIGFKGGIELPIKKSRIIEILKVIVVAVLALTIIKISWAILLHMLPYLSQYILL